MKIIILGAGQVGTTLAEHLVAEHNDITIIDIDGERLRTLSERMDLLTITGHGAYPNTLRRGGAEQADMVIAVTSSDETNLVACQIAHTLFQIPTKIARLRSLQYLAHEELFGAQTAFPLDVLISPEQLVTHHFHQLIEYPSALSILDFADQKVQLVSIKMQKESGILLHQSVKALNKLFPELNAKIVAIYRKGQGTIPNDETLLEPFDEVFFVATKQDVRNVMAKLVPIPSPNRRIMIAGGGNIGTRLASSLESQFQIKVIEKSKDRVENLATTLSTSIVLLGDASDKALLLNENIEDMDVFCAVTNVDEANIMSAILAKRLGARRVMALVTRPSYLDVVENGEIDIVVSPQQVTVGRLLTHIRRGHVVNVHSLRRGTAEAIEIVATGGASSSLVVSRAIKDITLPAGATIAAIVRGNKVLMAHEDQIIEENDHVIVFLTDKKKVRQVERLFQKEGILN